MNVVGRFVCFFADIQIRFLVGKPDYPRIMPHGLFSYFQPTNESNRRIKRIFECKPNDLKAGRSHFIAERIKIKRSWQKFVVWRLSLTDKLCFKPGFCFKFSLVDGWGLFTSTSLEPLVTRYSIWMESAFNPLSGRSRRQSLFSWSWTEPFIAIIIKSHERFSSSISI